ncbi:MAG: UDP-3-O-(3-hydroxymyristoyl)glucosamine N-acyltransferase [Alphaproteobacteria bacterium]|nr:UDP-3-O-(3-hydroxymyristoyl)glucosamine N-acyltransferase [Alphaproteobacteria bacterium]
MPRHTALAIADAVGGTLTGNGAVVLSRVAHPADTLGAGDLVLAIDPKLVPFLDGKQVTAMIVSRGVDVPDGMAQAVIAVDRGRLAMSALTRLFAETVPVAPGIHPTAVVEDGAKIGQNVTIGAQSFVGAGAVIGDNCVLHPQTYVAPRATLGADGLVYPGARIGMNVVIGARSIIHFNASVGADGFSFVTPEAGSVEQAKASGGGTVTAESNNQLLRIASLGAVIVGDDVEIGANTSIDRGTIVATRIGNGTKIDNQVQIGHNVTIGDNCLICGRVGIAGSAKIGNRVVLGGAVGVADHVSIGDDAVAMALSGIAGNVQAQSVVGGIPAMPRDRLMEQFMSIGRLKQFFKKIEDLTGRIDKLEGAG